MELTEEILNDADLFAAWAEGSARILHDEARDPADRIYAGCILAAFVTHTPGRPMRPWGTLPAELPAALDGAWTVAFDDDAVDQDRVDAALQLYRGLAETAQVEAAGEEILRRELDT